ncbi:unnamed protein product [Mytilus edulis]|uniref:Uncharacterized protein n=1 Tax=Mytilus edulis TaxID=6550 RepID=A0A8S3T6C6_MYTED|nr:unnamed protein product [Mytilus edulis]
MKLIFVEELKTFLFTNFLPFSGCDHCRHCHIQCDVHTNAPLPVVTGSPITTSKPHSSTCDIVAIFDAVARNQFVENVNATTCLNGKGRHGNDALVMTLCNAPESARWIEGEQHVRTVDTVVSIALVLLSSGTCSHSAKPYIPIFYHLGNVRRAVFPSGMRYNPSGEASESNANRQNTRADMELNLQNVFNMSDFISSTKLNKRKSNVINLFNIVDLILNTL